MAPEPGEQYWLGKHKERTPGRCGNSRPPPLSVRSPTRRRARGSMAVALHHALHHRCACLVPGLAAASTTATGKTSGTGSRPWRGGSVGRGTRTGTARRENIVYIISPHCALQGAGGHLLYAVHRTLDNHSPLWQRKKALRLPLAQYVMRSQARTSRRDGFLTIAGEEAGRSTDGLSGAPHLLQYTATVCTDFQTRRLQLLNAVTCFPTKHSTHTARHGCAAASVETPGCSKCATRLRPSLDGGLRGGGFRVRPPGGATR